MSTNAIKALMQTIMTAHLRFRAFLIVGMGLFADSTGAKASTTRKTGSIISRHIESRFPIMFAPNNETENAAAVVSTHFICELAWYPPAVSLNGMKPAEKNSQWNGLLASIEIRMIAPVLNKDEKSNSRP